MNLIIKKNRTSDILKIVFLIIYVLLILFSFRSSGQNASESSSLSEEVTNVVIDTIQVVDKDFNPDYNTLHTFIRKAVGHFGSFLLTGIFGLLTYAFFRLNLKWSLIISLIVGFVVSVSAELIQLFSDGRSCEIKDMFIDYSGYIVGTIISFIILVIVLKKKNSRKLD